MRRALLVNGVPASGKSTVGRLLLPSLTAAGACPVPLSLDTVKEGLFAEIGTGDRAHNRLLGRASYHAIFNAVAAFPDGLLPVVDAWHGFLPRSVLAAHLERARIDLVVEIWVAIAPATAAERYRARAGERHAGHLPASYADELFVLAGSARPMGFGPVIEMAGDSSPSAEAVAGMIAELDLRRP